MANSKAFHGISEADLGSVAAEIAPFLKGGGLVTLNGDLGMGKTAFARALIRHLTNAGEDVPSPTYTLLQTYNAPNMSIWHFDLYRLKSPDEVYELGWEDAVAPGNLVLIEWPERIEDLLPSHTS
ncbi:MAG TPA: tRNA (adenosine(37)-N6)-threonylcarbamoyltransferase complex ATPase subunit type 1 TsaE, partial [Alphaproteobacteria bacterium]